MQQLANMTMEGSRERRYFSAVAGDRTQQGELFGYANLFQMRRPGSNLALDILKVDIAYLNSYSGGGGGTGQTGFELRFTILQYFFVHYSNYCSGMVGIKYISLGYAITLVANFFAES